MEQILQVSDVSIKTATVEVKVMKIGNRQVTLAVFQQLPEKPIINPSNGELLGIPWGRVNYHPGIYWQGLEKIKDCKDERFHLHIVWQKDKELYRSTVFPVALGYGGSEILTEGWENLCGYVKGKQYSLFDFRQLDQLFIAV